MSQGATGIYRDLFIYSLASTREQLDNEATQQSTAQGSYKREPGQTPSIGICVQIHTEPYNAR